MAAASEIMVLAERMGLDGEELKQFVKEQQDLAREERNLRREELKVKEEQIQLETKKLDQELALHKEKMEFEEKKLQEEEEQRKIQVDMDNKRMSLEEALAKHKMDHEERQQQERLAIEREKLRIQQEQEEERRIGSLSKSKLPLFDEARDKFDAYITRFENFATVRRWKREEWAIQLSLLLTGKALETYDSLTPEQQCDYSTVREALLRRYSLTEDEFRRQFFSAQPESAETPSQFGVRLMRVMTRWIEYAHIPQEFEALKDLFVREQMLRRCHQDLAAYLREHKFKSYEELSKSAEIYIDAHGGSMSDPRVKLKQGKVKGGEKQGSGGNGKKEKNCVYCKKAGHDVSECRRTPGPDGKKRCFVCLSTEHLISECPKRRSGKSTVVASVGNPARGYKSGEQQSGPPTKSASKWVGLSEYISKGEVNGKPVNVMRDTGSNIIAVSVKLVEPGQYTGEFWNCLMADKTEKKYPIAKIPIKTKHISGEVQAAVMPSILWDLIVGNVVGVIEVASGKGNSCKKENVLTTKGQVANENNIMHVNEAEQPNPRLRAKEALHGLKGKFLKRARKLQTKRETEAVNDDQSITQLNHSESIVFPSVSIRSSSESNTISSSAVLSNSQDFNSVATVLTRAQARKKKEPLKVIPQECIDRDNLIKEQQSDTSLKIFWEHAQNGVSYERQRAIVSFVVKNGVLHRIYQKQGAVKISQIMVPVKLRDKVLRIAHDSLFSGHCGIRRTTERVTSNFYWPGVVHDVTRYCRSCEICQKTSVRGRDGRAPLGQMPVITIPFKRVAVDLVGPIFPASEEGHRWILTVVDYATRYPEAIPLKSTDTITVAEALLEIFSRVGVPDEILSDQGTQFVSELMKEVDKLLSIRQLTTTPYHPMCNGLVERFNGTLKRILKKLCCESPKQWHRYLPALLYAYRSTVQESTGYSPFELLYGRKVKGPMDILKAYWVNEDEKPEVKTIYEYIVDLKTRLENTCTLAQHELERSQRMQKMQYDRRSRPKNLKVGDKVLLLLPTKSNKLLLQWRGPFPVVKKVNAVNYIILVRGKEKTYHCNMLKPYYSREEDKQPLASVVCISDGSQHQTEEQELLLTCPTRSKESWKDVNICVELTEQQREELKVLLQQHQSTLTDMPGSTNIIQHQINLTTPEPIKVKPYPLPYAMREVINQEVKDMLSIGVIRESHSPYSSPPVIVKKPDGTNRFCVNYKMVNAFTVFDNEPMPDVEELFLKLRGSKFRTKMDLAKGYWQIEMEPQSIPLTAFSTHNGLYEFTRMPFGLVNSAASFNRLMRNVLGGIENVGCFVDDIVIYSDTWESHLSKIDEVLIALGKAGLTVRPSKCMVGYGNIQFLGHQLSTDTVMPRKEKVQEILEVTKPTTKRQVKSFIAMANYYSKFIPRFSEIMQPLIDLTKKNQPNKVVWGPNQEVAFKTIKHLLSLEPVLKIYDPNKISYVQTDASDYALGAVLLQQHDDLLHPVKYLSRKLKEAERNYSIIEKECLAIVWAIEKLKLFLYGKEFVLLVDNEPLRYLKESNIKNGRVMRWSLFLQDWSFRIQSIKGVENHVADWLSRI